MRYVYGPVPSRRLGRSLGVSPIPPKTCTYSCVYCQLGRTSKLQTKRESFFPPEEILGEIGEVLESDEGKGVDCVTFVGDGEPTLSLDIGYLIEKTKERWHVPTAIITNGSLLWMEKLRTELLPVDYFLFTLSAGSEKVWKKLHRPHGSLSFEKVLWGMREFATERHGAGKEVWAEVMLVKGVNDSDKALEDVADALMYVGVDRIYLMTPTRPPAEKWAVPPDPRTVLRARGVLARTGEVLEAVTVEDGDFGVEEFRDAGEAVMKISMRHPLRLEQALWIEEKFGEKGVVERLLSSGMLEKEEYMGHTYVFPVSVRKKKETIKNGENGN